MKKVIMRLMINDIVKLRERKTYKIYRVAQIAQSKKIAFAPLNEANVDTRHRSKESDFKYLFKSPSSLQLAKAKKITINELGVVSR